MRVLSIGFVIIGMVGMVLLISAGPNERDTDPYRLAVGLAVPLIASLLAIATAILDSYETEEDE